MSAKTQGTKKRLQTYPAPWFDKEKKSELYIYLANIKQGNIAKDFQFFKIQTSIKFHISSTPSVLLWGWH